MVRKSYIMLQSYKALDYIVGVGENNVCCFRFLSPQQSAQRQAKVSNLPILILGQCF